MKVTVNPHADGLLLQTRAHHVQLSSMADVKASMLITMSSILMTLAVPRVLRDGTHWPLVVLIIFCLGTILLAAYAVMPKIRTHVTPPTAADRALPRFNLLFFGDFSGMTYQQFKDEMEAVLNDPDLSYQVQMREIHSMGVYLAQTKYRYLRLAYLSLMIGLVSSFLVLLVVD